MTAAAPLEARGLRVDRGGGTVLDVPSFRLEEGEFISLIGPNGCGKSTLLLSLMCLLPRAAGQVLWRGAEVSSDRDAVALLEDRPLNSPEVDVVLVNRSYLRGMDQIDRRTVDAARAMLASAPGDAG